MTLDIIFRAERSGPFKGELTAVFPSLPFDYFGREMTCYAHIGQHSGCNADWYYTTRPAKPSEYADLLAELTRIYDDCALRVVRRRTRAHYDALGSEARHSRNELRGNPAGAPWSPAARAELADMGVL